MNSTDVRRRAAATVLAGLVLAVTACSGGGGRPEAQPSASAPTGQGGASTSSTPDDGGTKQAETATTAEGVTCLPVADATAQDIADGSIDPIEPVPGRSVAYRPEGMNGTYLVVMVFTGPGRAEPDYGVWAVKRSIEPDDHGPIQSIDRIARYVTSWPVARWVVEDDYRVSEARACTLV